MAHYTDLASHESAVVTVDTTTARTDVSVGGQLRRGQHVSGVELLWWYVAGPGAGPAFQLGLSSPFRIDSMGHGILRGTAQIPFTPGTLHMGAPLPVEISERVRFPESFTVDLYDLGITHPPLTGLTRALLQFRFALSEEGGSF